VTLDALRAFCAVLETGSFHAAAERIHRTQPAVSQQVKRLERELGHRLIDRSSGKPTAAGERAYEQGRRLLQDAESLQREITELDPALHRPLRVGTSDTTALYFLPEIVRSFARAMPDTRLEIVNRPSESIAEQVSQGELDLGIVTLPAEARGLEALDLFRQDLVLVAPTGHALARRKQLTLAALKNEPFLQLAPQTRTGTLLRHHFAESGFEPAVVLDSGSFEVIKRYVREGVGIAILPEMAVMAEDRDLCILRLRGLPSVRIGLVRRAGAYRSTAEEVFLGLVTGR
jgi:DNA-binding transcriptional LysR family regulator